MVSHFLPARSAHWILLHGLAQKLEALESDLDVLGPRPRALLDLPIEQLQRHLIARLLGHVEDEHPGEHLVKDDADGPNVDLVAVASASAPVSLDLLRWHHQGRSFEGERPVACT